MEGLNDSAGMRAGREPEHESGFEFPAEGGKLSPNKNRLAAGWRLLLYGAIFFVFWATSLFFLAEILRPSRGAFSPAYQLLGESLSFVAAFLAAWMLSLFEERPAGEYGLPINEASGKLFGQGCLFGFSEIGLLVGSISLFGGYSFGTFAQHGEAIAKWALFWGIFFFVVGLFEEFFFRGYSLHTLAEGIGFWPAAILLSFCFGAVHLQNSGEGWIGVASVALVGLFWCFSLKRTGSLWFAVGMHAAFDFGETFLFSVPDSGMIFPGHLSNAVLHGPRWMTGGKAGPEASVFDFLILLVFFFAVHILYPEGKLPQQVAGGS